jgi:hypothetical protein
MKDLRDHLVGTFFRDAPGVGELGADVVPNDATVRREPGQARAGDFQSLGDRKISRGVHRQAFKFVKAVRRVIARLCLLTEAEQESGSCLRRIGAEDVQFVGPAVGHVEQVVGTESKCANMF